jgi:hypothetical protein
MKAELSEAMRVALDDLIAKREREAAQAQEREQAERRAKEAKEVALGEWLDSQFVPGLSEYATFEHMGGFSRVASAGAVVMLRLPLAFPVRFRVVSQGGEFQLMNPPTFLVPRSGGQGVSDWQPCSTLSEALGVAQYEWNKVHAEEA